MHLTTLDLHAVAKYGAHGLIQGFRAVTHDQ